MSEMTPREIVQELDRYIIGQADAKRMVANALRMRWRRRQLDEELRNEITPKNILMMGPTGVGKTEIARRLAKLAHAPFIKVEATKFTEVGYVGRDVESIIRDLVDMSVKMTREEEMQKVRHLAQDLAEDRILDVLLPKPKFASGEFDGREGEERALEKSSKTRQIFRKKLREGDLDDKDIEIETSSNSSLEIMGPLGMEDMTRQLQSMFQNLGAGKSKTNKMKVKEAMRIVQEEEAAKLLNEDEVKTQAVEQVEQNGIVFIDEIDKVAKRNETGGSAEVSREGVQRDLLPLVEGCTVSTRYGMVKTDYILFIASGAFHYAKPSDLIPELQGRFPIRVELSALSVEDFTRILIEPDASLTAQYAALIGTEEVTLNFEETAIKRIAEVAWQVNERMENIGARRLHTVMERLLESISFEASEKSGQTVTVNQAYVDDHLSELVKDEDLSRYIL